MATTSSTSPSHEPIELHEIRVQGHLDGGWADRVGGLTLAHEPDGTKTLTGPLPDQAALTRARASPNVGHATTSSSTSQGTGRWRSSGARSRRWAPSSSSGDRAARG
jgi:hypothetical protein